VQFSGNPIFPGWYADPELHLFEGRYWIYPTTSLEYEFQTQFEAFSSDDLVHWRSEGVILDFADVPWSTNKCAWAPSCIEKDGRYYFYFSAGDGAGLGVAVSDHPGGPYHDPLGRPLVQQYHLGAQPIDAHAFMDDDGQAYLYWGGWKHCVASKLGDDMVSLTGEIVELTPMGYVEGPFMLKRNGIYYLMWSEGGWGDATYQVAYGMSDNPFGPFEREADIFLPSPGLASSAGHHSVLQIPGTDDWIIAYHRRPHGEVHRNHRVVCLDRLCFDSDGRILPIKPSAEGVSARRIAANAPDAVTDATAVCNSC
jgi:beta-xylosidase